MLLRNMSASPSQHEETYSISDLAREFDVTPRAIRFYEDHGLLAPQRSGSRRIYGKRDYVRLKLTLRGKRLGLSLSEVGAMFDLYDSARDEKPQLAKFLASLAERREQLERQRADIDEMLGEIAVFEAQCRKILAGGRKSGSKRTS
jgi:DNA-binding transcriptional MerR regulator